MTEEQERLEEERRNNTRIGEAEQKLYSNTSPDIVRIQHDPIINEQEEVEKNIPRTFAPEVQKKVVNYLKTEKADKLFRKILYFTIGFFVISILAATGLYLYGNNTVSSRNISININAPTSIPSSDPLTFDISIENRNNVDLMDSDIIIDYPEGSKRVDDDTRALVSESIPVGTVKRGEIIKKTANVRLFGGENSAKQIKATFHYKVSGSNSIFYKEGSHEIILRVAPIVLSINALKEVNNDQSVTLRAKITSNSSNTLKGVALNIDYPFGFTFKESNMETEDGNTGNFAIGDLNPNETKEVVITGKINGKNGEDKVFKYRLGTSETNDSQIVKTELVAFNHTMVIRGDFLSTVIMFDGNDKAPSAGGSVRGIIKWTNTLNVPVNDAVFSLKLSGALVDQTNVSVNQGYYRSDQGRIVWDKLSQPDLADIAPGETGQLVFVLPLAGYQQAVERNITNPHIDLVLDVSARRLTDRNVTEDITATISKQVPVATSVQLTGKNYHISGPIQNSGTVPPHAEQKTTYTIGFAISNSINDVSGAEVTATLPPYVTYENVISPTGESIAWNPNTHQLRWDIGKIKARTGYAGNAGKMVYFKVGFIPSKNQIGESPTLVTNISYKAHDDFSSVDLSGTIQNLNTTLDEAGVAQDSGQVVQ